MRFGIEDYALLDAKTVSLATIVPQLDFKNSNVAKPSVYVGLNKWSDMESLKKDMGDGTMRNIHAKEAPAEYIRIFNSIQLNATHYNVDNAAIEKWAGIASGKDFLFCPKMPQYITHQGFFNNKSPALKSFIDSIKILKNNLARC